MRDLVLRRVPGAVPAASDKPLSNPGAVLAGRLLVTFLLTVSVGGCTSTRTVQRSDPAALARLNRGLGGQSVVVVRKGWAEPGQFLHVFPDSLRWRSRGSLRSAPTADVRTLVLDPRRRNVTTGLVVGALFFTALLVGACAEYDVSAEDCALAVPAAAVGGAFTFGFYGLIGSPRVEYRLVD